jgi:hypothetical protein
MRLPGNLRSRGMELSFQLHLAAQNGAPKSSRSFWNIPWPRLTRPEPSLAGPAKLSAGSETNRNRPTLRIVESVRCSKDRIALSQGGCPGGPPALGVCMEARRSFDDFSRTLEWMHRRWRARIQLETLSPVATHGLIGILFLGAGCRVRRKQCFLQRCGLWVKSSQIRVIAQT